MIADTVLLGLDMDGVIIDHTESKIALAKDIGFDITAKETPSDILRKIIPEEFLSAFWDTLYNKDATALSAPLMLGIEDALENLDQRGVPYVLISRRKDPLIAERLLKARGLWPRFFSADNAFFVKEIEDKNTMAQALGVTHYIDDEINVLEALHDVKNRYLFDPHAIFPASTNYSKFSNWIEAVAHFSP
jgi:hypothetical protein